MKIRVPKVRDKGDNLIAVGMGFITLDIIITQADKQEISLRGGGSCGNVLTILSYLGWRTYPIANLSNNLASELIISDMKDRGVNVSFIRKSTLGRTPVVLERVFGKGSRESLHSYSMHCPFCNTVFPKFKPPSVAEVLKIQNAIAQPSVFYFDRAFPASLKMADALGDKHALVFFEPNNIGKEDYFIRALEVSHVLKCNERVYRHIVARRSRNWATPPIVIVTLGENGVKFRMNEGKWNYMKGYKVLDVTDTAGAGDWFTAGYLSSMFTQGGMRYNKPTRKKIERAIDEGQRLAALNCMYVGARDLMYSMPRESVVSLAKSFEREKHSVILNNKISRPVTKRPAGIDSESLCEVIHA